jgi:hypothetical protein
LEGWVGVVWPPEKHRRDFSDGGAEVARETPAWMWERKVWSSEGFEVDGWDRWKDWRDQLDSSREAAGGEEGPR